MVCEGGNPIAMQDKGDNNLLVNTDDMNFLSLLLFFFFKTKKCNEQKRALKVNVSKVSSACFLSILQSSQSQQCVPEAASARVSGQ